MSYDSGAETANEILGLPFVTVGPAGSTYPVPAYGNSFGKALNAALAAAGTGNVPKFAIVIGPGTWVIDQQVVLLSPGQVLQGSGVGVTVLEPAAALGMDAISLNALISPVRMSIGNFTFNGTLVTSGVAAATTISIASTGPITYVHGQASGGSGATAWTTTAATTGGFVKLGVAGVTFTPGATHCALTQVGGSAQSLGSTSAKVAALLSQGSGIWMNIGDTLLFTWSGGTPTATWQQNNGYLNLETQAYVTGSESGTNTVVSNISFLNSQYVGSSGSNSFIFNGNEDGLIFNVQGGIGGANPNGGIECQTYNGYIRFVGCKADAWIIGAIQMDWFGCIIGETGVIWTNASQQTGSFNVYGGFANGVTGSVSTFTFNNAVVITFKLDGMKIIGGQSGVSATTFFQGTVGLPNTECVFVQPRFIQGSLGNNPNLFASSPLSVQGYYALDNNSNFTVANSQVNIPAGSTYSVLFGGVITYVSGAAPTYYGTGGAPTGQSSATIVMAGLANATAALLTPVYPPGAGQAVFTPTLTGKMRVTFKFNAVNSTAADGWVAEARVGTPSSNAPANDAAVTGTLIGSTNASVVGETGVTLMALYQGVVGTSYWFDLGFSYKATGGTVTLSNCDVTIEELQQ